MGIWDMFPLITIIAIVAIIAEAVKELAKNRAKAKMANNDEIVKFRDLVSNMQADLEEIKSDLRTIVIQMDDFKLYKVDSSVVDKKE